MDPLPSKHIFPAQQTSELGEPMASLQRETLTIIETCRSVLAVPKRLRPNIDTRTIGTARRILAKLKEGDPTDATLSTINLDDSLLNWWEILYAMEAAEMLLVRRLDRKPP